MLTYTAQPLKHPSFAQALVHPWRRRVGTPEFGQRWTFDDLDPARQYQVFVSYVPGTDRASNAPYEIAGGQEVGGGASTKTVLVDQRYAVGSEHGYYWAGHAEAMAMSRGFVVAIG